MYSNLTARVPSRHSAGAELALKRRLREGLCLRLMATTLMAALFTIINPSPSKADMNLKLYAYNLMSWKQFECYNWLISKESSWNPKARNGSHYGLGQMRSKWYGTLHPHKQIRVHMKYLSHRYGGDACKALAHLERKGWH